MRLLSILKRFTEVISFHFLFLSFFRFFCHRAQGRNDYIVLSFVWCLCKCLSDAVIKSYTLPLFLFYVTLVFPLAFEFEKISAITRFLEKPLSLKYILFVCLVDFYSLLFDSYASSVTFLSVQSYSILFFKRMLHLIDFYFIFLFNVVSSQGRVMLLFPWALL